jgi:hypothetical protein
VVHNFLNFVIILNKIRWNCNHSTSHHIMSLMGYSLATYMSCDTTDVSFGCIYCFAHYFCNFKLIKLSVREEFCNINICATEAHCFLRRKEKRNKNSSFKKCSVLIILFDVYKCVVLRNLCFYKWSMGNYQYSIFWVSQGTRYLK